MGFFDNVFTSADGRTAANGIFDFLFNTSGSETKATASTALTLSAFYNAVNQISDDVAKLPKHVYRKTTRGRELVDTPLNYLVNVSPNDLMTAYDFWKVNVATVILSGNAYSRIYRNSDSEPALFEFLGGDQEVLVYMKNNRLVYYHQGEEISGSDVLHFKLFSLDGVMGTSVIRYAANSLGVSLDVQSFASGIYKDRGIGYGVIESEQAVTAPNKKAIEDAFSAKMASGNKFRIPMLDSGLKYKSISVTPEEAKFIETDKRGILEVCRWLNIAPHKLKVLDNANFSNIYHQSTEHVQDSILPWMVRFEQELQRKIFGKENSDYYLKFNEKVLLRGDLDSKQRFYSSGVFAGYMTRNEVREYEDLNPLPGLDEPMQPVNMELLSHIIENHKKQLEDDKNS